MKSDIIPSRKAMSASLFSIRITWIPRKLRGIHVIRIENKEADIAFLEGIISLFIHVKKLIETLVRVVVVAQGGTKLYAGIEQCFIGRLKLLHQILWTLRSVNVVAQHNH